MSAALQSSLSPGLALAEVAPPAPGSALVLGGTGFVGRHVCRALRTRGYDVVTAARSRPAEASSDPFVALDLGTGSAATLGQALSTLRPRLVVNTVGSIWGRTDEQMWRATADPVFRLLDALSLLAYRPRLVHLGTVLEYGPVAQGESMGGTAGAGGAAAAPPTTAYGQAKLAATQAVLERTKAGDVEGMVLRIANVAGPGSPAVSLLGRVAAVLLAAQALGEPAELTLDALIARRDYVDVRDVADAVVAACATEHPQPVVLDIGSGVAVPVRDLVELLVEVSGIETRIVERPPAHPRADISWTRLNIAAAADVLGWRPTRSLEDSVRAFWAEARAAAGAPQ